MPQDAGTIIGALGLSWGIFAIIMGGMSDKIGLRKVLIPAIIGFSLLSGLSGMATGLMSLVLIRVVMGFTEGSFAPTSFAATNDASHPTRLGINQGLQQCGFALFGLAFAPIIATQLLQFMSWRWVFVMVAVPGLILGMLMYFVIREPLNRAAAGRGNPHAAPKGNWSEVLKSRNIVLSMAALFCAMTGVFVLSGMLSIYLTAYLKLTLQQTGFVASAVGLGGFIGQFAWPGISDMLGRRPTAILGFVGAADHAVLLPFAGAQHDDAVRVPVRRRVLHARFGGASDGSHCHRGRADRSDFLCHRPGGGFGRNLGGHRAGDRGLHRAEFRHPEHTLFAPRGGDFGRPDHVFPERDGAQEDCERNW